ncbi:hypothetical protein PIROE2DRAFT_16734 [Piromyces sp. E2]|nr:hypothetical protein PIROE2DRAFT_16734 [Piromyces sp. E2]|eukprot:OUM58087.1 hypothetical protein PIROE2DRAFT_16734 [Piromyces sp. E2]
MDINLSVQDERGMTALMYASENPELLFVLKDIIDGNDDNSLYLVDKNGENAYFHAVHNMKAFEVLLESKKMAEKINQLNNNNDSVLTYCCRNGIYEPIIPLLRNAYVDPNIFNNEEKTALMYLVEQERYEEMIFLKKWKTNFNYVNSKNESAITILIRQYYKYYKENNGNVLKNYIRMNKILLEKECSFNAVIDEEGNTAFIINEASIASKICIPNVIELCISRNEFDTNVKNSLNFNLLMNFIINNLIKNVNDILRKNEELVGQVNDRMETPLIIAARLGNKEIMKKILLLHSAKANIDQQDMLGNTALHYALESGDKYIINNLAFHHANIHIKNKEGKSPIEIAKESENDEIMKLLKNPVSPHKLSKKKSKEGKKSITSLFKKKKEKDSQIEIDNGDIVISKSNTCQKEYEDCIKITSKLYKITDNIVLNSALQDYEISVYPMYGDIGDIQLYNREIWNGNMINGMIIIDDKTKRIARDLAYSALVVGGVATGVYGEVYLR